MPSLFRRLVAPSPRTIERDSVSLTLANGDTVQIARVRDPRAKRIKLSIDERGARLTLPPRASLIAGERFLHQHRDWLAAQLARHATPDDLPALRRGETTALPLRGESLPLHWHEGRYTRLELDGDALHFHATARAGDAALRRALRDFYESQARADVGRWLPRYLPSLPRAPRQIRFKMPSSLWGSLAPDGSVSLDLSLVLGRPAAFEYVLVHELCHLLRRDHSPAFWQEVERRFPAWREQRDYFHAEGRKLKTSLRALLVPPGA
ncbi:MAG: SprT family zinc-dependent metalloprotease [Pseudoxanthomonas sp.]